MAYPFQHQWSSMTASPLKMGPRGFSKLLETKNQGCIMSQKSKGLSYIKVEAWNHKDGAFFILPLNNTYLLFSDSQHSVCTIHHFEAHSQIIRYLTDDTQISQMCSALLTSTFLQCSPDGQPQIISYISLLVAEMCIHPGASNFSLFASQQLMKYPKYTSAVTYTLIILNKSVLSQMNSVTKKTVFVDVQTCSLVHTHR